MGTLVEWQDSLLEMAKGHLRARKNYQPMLYLLVVKPWVADGVKARFPENTWWPYSKGTTDPSLQRWIIEVPLPHDWNRSFDFYSTVGTPDLQMWLQEAHRMATKMRLPYPEKAVMQGFLMSAKMSEKDMLHDEMSFWIANTKALAYVFINEAWTLRKVLEDRSKVFIPQSLRNHPDRQECLMSVMEDATMTRTVTLPFIRATPETGKVRTFGDPLVMEEREGDDTIMPWSRFLHIMRKNPSLKDATRLSSN